MLRTLMEVAESSDFFEAGLLLAIVSESLSLYRISYAEA